MSKFLEEFDIEEKPFSYLAEQYPNLVIKNQVFERLDSDRQVCIPIPTLSHFDESIYDLRLSIVLIIRSLNTNNFVSVLVHDPK